jgi:hypothetical protein
VLLGDDQAALRLRGHEFLLFGAESARR